METPLIRPGRIENGEGPPVVTRVVAYFPNAAPANAVIQLLLTIGIRSDQLGVTTPDRMPGSQGMLLSIPCRDNRQAASVEEICRKQGAEIHRQRG